MAKAMVREMMADASSGKRDARFVEADEERGKMLAAAAGHEERKHILSVLHEPERSTVEVAMLTAAAKTPAKRAQMLALEVSSEGRERYLETVEAVDPILRGESEAQMLRVMPTETRKAYLKTLNPAKKAWIPALNLPREPKPEPKEHDARFFVEFPVCLHRPVPSVSSKARPERMARSAPPSFSYPRVAFHFMPHSPFCAVASVKPKGNKPGQAPS